MAQNTQSLVNSDQNQGNFRFITNDYSSHLNCPLCTNLMIRPMRLHPCGHTYCQDCINGYELNDSRSVASSSKKGKKKSQLKQPINCPSYNCKCKIKVIQKDRTAESLIDELKVSCSNEGCVWKGSFDKYKKIHKQKCHLKEGLTNWIASMNGNISRRTENNINIENVLVEGGFEKSDPQERQDLDVQKKERTELYITQDRFSGMCDDYQDTIKSQKKAGTTSNVIWEDKQLVEFTQPYSFSLEPVGQEKKEVRHDQELRQDEELRHDDEFGQSEGEGGKDWKKNICKYKSEQKFNIAQSTLSKPQTNVNYEKDNKRTTKPMRTLTHGQFPKQSVVDKKKLMSSNSNSNASSNERPSSLHSRKGRSKSSNSSQNGRIMNGSINRSDSSSGSLSRRQIAIKPPLVVPSVLPSLSGSNNADSNISDMPQTEQNQKNQQGHQDGINQTKLNISGDSNLSFNFQINMSAGNQAGSRSAQIEQQRKNRFLQKKLKKLN